MKKPDADRLIKKTNKDPEENLFYHPSILHNTIAGAVIGGIILGAIAWMMAKGIIPVEGLGQMAASGLGATAFLGFVAGSAIGGLIGSVYGIFVMLKRK
jgi:hypothetical protein